MGLSFEYVLFHLLQTAIMKPPEKSKEHFLTFCIKLFIQCHVMYHFGRQHITYNLVVAYVGGLLNLVDSVATYHHMAAPSIIQCIL